MNLCDLNFEEGVLCALGTAKQIYGFLIILNLYAFKICKAL